MTVKSIKETKEKRVLIPSREETGPEAAALAKIRKAEFITGDREFRVLENEVKIVWII